MLQKVEGGCHIPETIKIRQSAEKNFWWHLGKYLRMEVCHYGGFTIFNVNSALCVHAFCMITFVMFFVLEQSKEKRESGYYKRSVAFFFWYFTVKSSPENAANISLLVGEELFYWPKVFIMCTLCLWVCPVCMCMLENNMLIYRGLRIKEF